MQKNQLVRSLGVGAAMLALGTVVEALTGQSFAWGEPVPPIPPPA